MAPAGFPEEDLWNVPPQVHVPFLSCQFIFCVSRLNARSLSPRNPGRRSRCLLPASPAIPNRPNQIADGRCFSLGEARSGRCAPACITPLPQQQLELSRSRAARRGSHGSPRSSSEYVVSSLGDRIVPFSSRPRNGTAGRRENLTHQPLLGPGGRRRPRRGRRRRGGGRGRARGIPSGDRGRAGGADDTRAAGQEDALLRASPPVPVQGSPKLGG